MTAVMAQGCQMIGIFSNQKSQFEYILEGLAMEGVGVFYVHLVYFTDIWYISWAFGIHI
jgi:hypothetical protein